MINLEKELKDMKFERKGSIKIVCENKHPVFDVKREKLEGNVYMWVKEDGEKLDEVLYIGKAGKTLFKRCVEHIGGFRGGSKKGKKNATELITILKEGANIGIWSRHSDTTSILGVNDISLCEAEEKALIKRYKDRFSLFNKS